mmetsp:Transcript_123269/g.227087  ORF Transcript_123269/g.227087 Transcript_123269/m.227087 type:complete len:112 (-) Transcript_123269:106-441(-)
MPGDVTVFACSFMSGKYEETSKSLKQVTIEKDQVQQLLQENNQQKMDAVSKSEETRKSLERAILEKDHFKQKLMEKTKSFLVGCCLFARCTGCGLLANSAAKTHVKGGKWA